MVVQLSWTAALLALFACLVFGPTIYELFSGSNQEQERAAGLFLDLHARLWPALIGLAAAMAALTVTQSHRVFGPLVRFKAVFEAVARGELWVPSKIRLGDYPLEESRALDAMLASLRQRIGDAQRATTSVDDALKRLPPGTSDDAYAALGRLRQTLGAFEVDHPPAGGGTSPESPVRPIPPADAGFTLIEILLVVALIGVVAAIAVPGYEAALERARVTRAIGDIRAIQGEAQAHEVLNGCYPGTLAEINFDRSRDPWGSPYVYAVLEGAPERGGGGGGGGGGASCAACNGACIGRGEARKDHNLVPINSNFDLYSMGRDHESAGPLTAGPSRDDIVRASDGGFIGLGRDY